MDAESWMILDITVSHETDTDFESWILSPYIINYFF
jgi:hypothetical protein